MNVDSKAIATRHLLPIALCLLCIAATFRTTALVSSEFNSLQLTHKEQQLLESLTCRNKFNVGADKIIASGDARTNPTESYAEVLCRPHDNFKLNSIHHVIFCEKHRSPWKCPRTELAIRMNDNTHALVYFEDDIRIDTAYSIVMKLASSKYYQGEDIPKPEKSVCNIHHHFNDDHQLVPDVYVATCGIQEVFISTWCPQQECPRIIGKRIISDATKNVDGYPVLHAALYSKPNLRIFSISVA